MTAILAERSIHERALETLRRSGNPFRNFFARNPDDEVCARYHVAELYAREREQLLAVVDRYRYDPTMHSEVVPVLGNKGSGKTHLLHSIKHGQAGGRQLLVTPGTYQKGVDFLEYLLFQMIDTLLGGGRQRGVRPLEYVGGELSRRLLRAALQALDARQRLDLFPAPALARWARKLGLGASQADERRQWLIDVLEHPGGVAVQKACLDVGLDPARACDLIFAYVDRSEIHNAAGQLRRRIYQGFARAALLHQEGELAGFLTHGFADLEYRVRPTRQDLVLAVTKVLMEVFLSLNMPVVVAFDQLEDLLLVRRTDDAHKVSESFFAGIVQVMHQVDGICFLIFAERGLWNRFVPSLDGYIQDRLNNPIHVPNYGTIKALKLDPPPPTLVWQVVAARLRPALEELPDFADLSPIFPFTDEQVARVARTEPTLRDMLQQFRHLFDHLVYGGNAANLFETDPDAGDESTPAAAEHAPPRILPPGVKAVTIVETPAARTPLHDLPDPSRWSIEESPAAGNYSSPHAPREGLQPAAADGPASFSELWDHAVASARAKLGPEGALTGATRELQAGLGAFLQVCHEHGVKLGPWRLQHVVPEFAFGDHPTYGILTIAHWACKDAAPWRVGVGLFLGRGPGKPRDLATKLASFDGQPPVIDQLVLLRPADDTVLTGKSKALWDQAVEAGRQVRIEPAQLDEFAVLYAFPRWLAAVAESLPAGRPLPNLADFLQTACARLLEQIALPVNSPPAMDRR